MPLKATKWVTDLLWRDASSGCGWAFIQILSQVNKDNKNELPYFPDYIVKPGKDPSCPSSYRPIDLTAVLMERMVTNRLVSLVQFISLKVQVSMWAIKIGLELVRSTIDSVAVLDQDIKKAIINKEGVIAVLLDIKKAYDSMWKDGLLLKLHDAVVKGRMFYWIKDFLNNRSIQVKIRGDLAALNILLYDCQVEKELNHLRSLVYGWIQDSHGKET